MKATGNGCEVTHLLFEIDFFVRFLEIENSVDNLIAACGAKL